MTKTITVEGRELIICGRPGDPYFDHMDLGNHTNDFLLFVAKHYVPDDAIIFDIGANIGVTSSFLATKACNGQVYAFEPGAETYSYLLATFEANHLMNCHSQQIALGAIAGEANFFSNPNSGAASHLSFDGVSLGGANASVKIKTMDEVVSEIGLTRLDFVKIDVEGFELDVLQGGKHTIEKFKPNVFLEFNSFTLIAYGNKNPRHVIEYLKLAFPHVYRFESGIMHEITDAESILAFIHDNLVKRGCVDDLLCTFEPITSVKASLAIDEQKSMPLH